MATAAQRTALQKYMKFLYDNNEYINYNNDRPFPLESYSALETLFKDKKTISWDCSGAVVELCYLAGVGDPTGGDYWGYGNTSNMLAELPNYTNPKHCQPGAIVIFGKNLPLAQQHACMVYESQGGGNPWLFSHGSNAGPLILQLSEEATAHPGADITFLSVAKL